jgi:hypothetical protein
MKNRFLSILIIFVFIFILGSISLKAQVELVPVENPVYDFLKRMQLEELIPEYNSGNIPISRVEVAEFLKTIKLQYNNLARIDRNLLDDYYVEFGYDINNSLKNTSSFLGKSRDKNIFEDKKQKHMFAYMDSTVAFFFDVGGSLSKRNSKGDEIGNNSILLGDLNFRMRGTFFNTLGFYLRPTGGKRISGERKDSWFASKTDVKLGTSNHWGGEGETYEIFEGYLRYQSKNNSVAVTLGREALNQGFGYNDKMLLSNNTVPFDFVRLDLSYKILKYSFFYGALRGDSLFKDIKYKNISMQRLDVQFSNSFRMGFWDALVISDNAFSLNYINPLSLLFNADLNTNNDQTMTNNSLFAFDCEYVPIKNLAIQGTVFIDDWNFSSFYKKDSTSNDNKLAYQLGFMWSNAFTLPGMSFSMEYTKIDPFTYTHRTNKSQYTNAFFPLGPLLPPNGDEISVKVIYNATNRLRLDFLYRHQRSAEGLEFDSTGKLTRNYGGYIWRGDGDFLHYNEFLGGNRVNRDILTFNLRFEPIRQYFFEFKYQYEYQNLLYLNKKVKDHIFFLTFRLDY